MLLKEDNIFNTVGKIFEIRWAIFWKIALKESIFSKKDKLLKDCTKLDLSALENHFKNQLFSSYSHRKKKEALKANLDLFSNIK